MRITDWDAWMKEHHIYIPTKEEIEEAKRRNFIKVHLRQKLVETSKSELEAIKKKVTETSH